MMLPDGTTYNSAILDSAKVITGDGWNSANNWQTLYNSFYCKGGKVRIGFSPCLKPVFFTLFSSTNP